MEVHAHTHTPRKKWTHYLWEFLMLFLAVFCGFLAENKREHIVEHKRAKAYAKALLNDLQLDTSEIRRGIHQTNFIIASIDSLVAMSSVMPAGGPAPASFYYYSKFTFNGFRIDWSRSTIDQLIQSGSLRYFRNKELIGAMNFYYYLQGIISAQNQMDLVHRDKITEIRNSILQSRYYTPFAQLDIVREEFGSPGVDSLMKSVLPLQPGAAEKMDGYINNIADRKSRLRVIVNRYYTLSNKVAVEIIKLLTEEFNFKQEDFNK